MVQSQGAFVEIRQIDPSETDKFPDKPNDRLGCGQDKIANRISENGIRISNPPTNDL